MYFSTIANRVDSGRESPDIDEIDESKKIDRDIGTDFVIGRLVLPRFFRDKHILFPANRGLCPCSYSLLMAEIEIQILCIKNLSTSLMDDYYLEMNVDLAENQKEVLRICYDLKKFIPDIFSLRDPLKHVKLLCHDDFPGSNIIVDPISYFLNGIIN